MVITAKLQTGQSSSHYTIIKYLSKEASALWPLLNSMVGVHPKHICTVHITSTTLRSNSLVASWLWYDWALELVRCRVKPGSCNVYELSLPGQACIRWSSSLSITIWHWEFSGPDVNKGKLLWVQFATGFPSLGVWVGNEGLPGRLSVRAQGRRLVFWSSWDQKNQHAEYKALLTNQSWFTQHWQGSRQTSACPLSAVHLFHPGGFLPIPSRHILKN